MPGPIDILRYIGFVLGQGTWLSVAALVVLVIGSLALLEWLYHREQLGTELAFASRSVHEARARGTLLYEMSPQPRTMWWRGSTLTIRQAWVERAPVRNPNGLVAWDCALCFVLDSVHPHTAFKNVLNGDLAVVPALRPPLAPDAAQDESAPPPIYALGIGQEHVVIRIRIVSTSGTPGIQPIVDFR